MDEDVFKEEDDFFCSICGEKIIMNHEIDEEICNICLTSILDGEEIKQNIEVHLKE